jgi:serine/threonine protein kinase
MSFDSSTRESGRVGQYRLLQRLGEGGMGVVHLGLDPDGKAVAIKVLRPHIASDPDARIRLAREVATLRRVRHPQVAAVIDADVDGEVPYVVTTFVPGKPLDIHIRDHGPLPRGHVARIGAVLADALRTIHAAGVVHRDVKPANVMLLDGDPILIDFGIAHVADESRITHTGLVMGTPGYLSPEIIGGEPVTAATDWWGWGATLAFAATGRPPFGTGPIEVVLERVRRGQSDIAGVDAGLRATLTAALSVDPMHRPSPERLVAGLAAMAPARHGHRNGVDAARSAAVTSVVNSAGLDREDRQDLTTERTPPPREHLTTRTPPPNRADEAVTAVVPPPAPWSASGLPATSRFDPPNRNGAPNGYAVVNPSGAGGPNGVGPNGVGLNGAGANGVVGANGAGAPVAAPANGFAGRNAAAGPPSPPAPPSPAPSPRAGWRPADLDPPAPIAAPDSSSGPGRDFGEPARGVLFGVMVVLAAVAGVAPYGATWIAALLIVAARVVDRSTASLMAKRDQRGPRGSDGLMTVLALPWRLVTAGVATVLALILPILIGISVAFIIASAIAGAAIKPGTPVPLAAGMVALLLTAWFGPGSAGLRNGANRGVRFVVPGRRAQLVVWSVLALVLISGIVVARDADHAPDWGPLNRVDLIQQLATT